MLTEKIKVVIFEDNAHLRDSLYFLMNTSNEFECINAYPDTKNVLLNLKKNTPDLVIMDIEMPGMDGIETTRLIKKDFPSIQVLMFTVFNDNDKIFQSLCAGGSGYLLKTSSPEQILQALKDVYNSGSALSPAVAKRMVQFFQQNIPDTNEVYNLTVKEKELLHHMINGKSYKMIGDAMNITIETVKSHVKNIYRKLHVNSSSEAVAKAIKQRIIY